MNDNIIRNSSGYNCWNVSKDFTVKNVPVHFSDILSHLYGIRPQDIFDSLWKYGKPGLKCDMISIFVLPVFRGIDTFFRQVQYCCPLV